MLSDQIQPHFEYKSPKNLLISDWYGSNYNAYNIKGISPNDEIRL